MAEDDDDEAFGDFAFAPFQSNSQFNGLNSSAAADAADEDDDWGDFVQTPQQSKPFETSFNGNHQSDNSASPTTWMKPSGAFPLSIFGDAEEEEAAVVDNLDVARDLNQGKSNGIGGNFGSNLVNNGVSNSHSFSVTDLYNQYSQIKPGNQAGSDSTGKVDSVENGVHSSSNQNDARSDVTDVKNVDLNDTLGISDKNHFTKKSADEEFSFKSNDPDPSAKEDPFGGWTPEFNGFSSNLKTTPQNLQTSSTDLDMNGEKQQLDSSAIAIDDDDDGDGWEFKDAYSESQVQEVNNNVNLMVHEVSERSADSSGTGIGSTKSVDLFGTSNGSIDFFARSAQPVDYFTNSSGMVHEVSERSADSSGTGTGSSKSLDLFGTSNGSIEFFRRSAEPVDYFARSSGMVHEVSERSADPSGTGTGSNKSVDLFGTSNGSIDFFSKSTVVHEVSERSADSSGTGTGSNKSVDLFGTSNGSIDFFSKSTEPVDYFANSSGISSTSQEVELIGIQQSIATLNGFTSDADSIVVQNNDKSLSNHRTDVGIDEQDEDFGEFTAASAETGPNSGEVSTNDVLSPVQDALSTPDGKIQENETKLNHHKSAIPLSVFGNEEPESGGSSDFQDLFLHQSTSEQRDNLTAAKVISINDLISNLYSQAEQTSSVNTAQNATGTQLNLSSALSSSNLVNDDDLDDSSWDFKDASEMRVDSGASLSSMGDTYMSISSKLKLNNYLDFYNKLKEELFFLAKCHIESLKQARDNAALSGEDARAASLDSEFQLVYKELEQMNFLSEESAAQDCPSGDSSLNEFAQVLLEPQFQRLESEYHLSQKLLLVEKDLGSTMELIKHTNAMLKILTIGTLEEQKVYVSLWSEMISVCAQELKHGASIWNQAVDKQVQSQLLSKPQGRKFILAIGEIYRVVVVLGASAKLFKPWILSASVDSSAIYNLLEECHAVWSTSVLEEALGSVSALSTLDNTSLFKSIKHILGLDAHKLQDYVFTEKDSRCRLSILTAGVVPDMEMIMWGNEQCFVALANLWANLISRDPPKLPQLNLG